MSGNNCQYHHDQNAAHAPANFDARAYRVENEGKCHSKGKYRCEKGNNRIPEDHSQSLVDTRSVPSRLG